MKAEKRRSENLPPQDEDTMEIARTMRSSSPPASASDLLEAQNQKRNTRPIRRVCNTLFFISVGVASECYSLGFIVAYGRRCGHYQGIEYK